MKIHFSVNDRAVEEYLVSSGVTLQQSSQCRNNLGRIGRNADYNNVLCGQYDAANQAFCPGKYTINTVNFVFVIDC